jgi:hypothetical protein
MIVTESNEGAYRIYAAAIRGEDPGDGFSAAVVIARRELLPLGEALRDLDIGAGRRWSDSDEALQFAVGRARAVNSTEPHRLAC